MTKAIDLFTAVPRMHNCSQAVAEACGRNDLVPELASCGGGRAPEGLCGALYAALAIVPDSQKEQIAKTFAQQTGSTLCKEIKAGNVPCTTCVQLAEALALAEINKKYK